MNATSAEMPMRLSFATGAMDWAHIDDVHEIAEALFYGVQFLMTGDPSIAVRCWRRHVRILPFSLALSVYLADQGSDSLLNLLVHG